LVCNQYAVELLGALRKIVQRISMEPAVVDPSGNRISAWQLATSDCGAGHLPMLVA